VHPASTVLHRSDCHWLPRRVRARLERARNAVISLWSRLEAHTAFGLRRDDLDELHRRLDEANQRVAGCQTLVTGWTELADEKLAAASCWPLSRMI
jgi:hypothetical protein